jgi:hypothetical protein
MISPPGMLTVVMPMRCQTSAAMPVCRHFMPLKSARFFTGRLNQPNACGPDGRIGIQCTFRLQHLLEELVAHLVAAAVVHPADGVDHVHAEGAAGAAGAQDRGLVLADPVARPACAPSSTFLCVASSTSNAGTTCPAGIASILSGRWRSCRRARRST